MTHPNNARYTSVYYQRHKDEIKVKHQQRRDTKQNKRLVVAELKDVLHSKYGVKQEPTVLQPQTYERQCASSGMRFSVQKKNVVITF